VSKFSKPAPLPRESQEFINGAGRPTVELVPKNNEPETSSNQFERPVRGRLTRGLVIRLSDDEHALLKQMSKARDKSLGKILRELVIPELEKFALER